MNLDNNILALVEPTIEPRKLETPSRGEEEGGDRITKTFAIDSPLITVNGYVFEKNDVTSMTLSSAGVIPTINVTLVDSKNIFTIDNFPRDSDVVTLYINSKAQSTFKSIHLDFEILSINAVPKKEGDPKKIRISGRVKVPKLFAENCQHFEANNSLEHLTSVIKQLKLGLASNIDETVDIQTRIQPYISYIDFISQIVSSSYISDDSFQNFFIDPYYYLNFIDVNKVFNSPNPPISEWQENMVSANVSFGEQGEVDEDIDSTNTKLFLTNKIDFKASNMYIAKYNIINNSNVINETHGQFRDVQIYDNNAEAKLDEFRIESLSSTSENLKDIQEPLRGNRETEEYLDEVKHKYIGRQDVGEDGLGNVHPNYIFAQLHNRRNIDETQKIKLEVTLESFNPSLYRFQKIPVLMYHIDSGTIKKAIELDDIKKDKGFTDSAIDTSQSTQDENPSQVQDQFLSGYYLVESIDIVYRGGGFYQKVVLIRREWPARMNSI